MAEQYLKERDFTWQEGFAIDFEEMNPNDCIELLFAGKTLQEAIQDYVRKTSWWAYNPSNGELVFEDLWDAVVYAEDISDVSFDQFKKSFPISTKVGNKTRKTTIF